MKIKNKNIKKSVDNVTLEFKRTLTKAIIDLMKLTGCKSGDYYSFREPIVFISAQKRGKLGMFLNSDIILVDGLRFYDDRDNTPFLMAYYDYDSMFSSIYWNTENYMLIYNAVRKSILNY